MKAYAIQARASFSNDRAALAVTRIGILLLRKGSMAQAMQLVTIVRNRFTLNDGVVWCDYILEPSDAASFPAIGSRYAGDVVN